MHSFTTERLLISPINEQDKELYISLYTDENIMRYIDTPLSKEAAESAFSRTIKAIQKQKPSVITWTIVTLEDNKCIGIQALNWQRSQLNYSKKANIPEIGIMLLPQAHKRLLAEEALGALVEYAFNHFSLNQINACFEKENIAMVRVAQKTGFSTDRTQQPTDPLQQVDSVYRESWHRQYIKTQLG